MNERVKLNYNFAIDQNFNQINYNEIGTEFNFNPIKIDFNFIEESKHIEIKSTLKQTLKFQKMRMDSFHFQQKEIY